MGRQLEAPAGSTIPVLGLWAPARQGRACSVQSKTGCTRERPSNCCCEAEEKLILILESIPAWEGSASTRIGRVAGVCRCSRGPCSLNLGDVQPSGCPRQHHPPPRAPQARPHLPAQEEALAPASRPEGLGHALHGAGPSPRAPLSSTKMSPHPPPTRCKAAGRSAGANRTTSCTCPGCSAAPP